MKPIEIAAVCHEANRELTRILKDVPLQAHWDDCDADMKAMVLKGIEWRCNNPDAPASASHEAWMQDRLSLGWVLGPERSNEKKTHPALVPYKDLPPGVQLKDKVFVSIILALRDAPTPVKFEPLKEMDEYAAKLQEARTEQFDCGHKIRVDLNEEVLQDLRVLHGVNARVEMQAALDHERLRHREGLCAGGDDVSRIESKDIDGVRHFYLMTGEAILRELSPLSK